jgi:cell wall-associated protease
MPCCLIGRAFCAGDPADSRRSQANLVTPAKTSVYLNVLALPLQTKTYIFMNVFTFFIFLFFAPAVFSQNPSSSRPPANWQLMDLQKDSVHGTSVNRAYAELLKGKKSHTIIVAVIDVGVDTVHEDLKGRIWTNPKETPGNGADDDRNGYADDMHGWNFLGGKDGRNILKESYESEREYYRIQPLYSAVHDSVTAKSMQLKEYGFWTQLKNLRLKDSIRNKRNIETYTNYSLEEQREDSVFKLSIAKDTLYYSDIEKMSPPDTVSAQMRRHVLADYQNYKISHSLSFEALLAADKEGLENAKERMRALDIDPNAQRRDIVGDDPENIKDRNYGNNDVSAGYQAHGTHVSGIIAAIRGNGIGMDGIADHAIIMPVRASCDGDERDKDVALAIRYAVDNGAKIINMSFGKPFSPGKEWVDEAVRYAAKKGVLIIHAAGNDAANSDSIPFYPSAYFKSNGEKADNFITVGASASSDSFLVAGFSNYGKTVVDVFAPGVSIYSTVPGNKYEWDNGTSMASPVVAGIAALIWSYFPNLTYRQVKYCIEKSATPINTLVTRPGSNQKVPFSSLSRTGGIVNAYTAVWIARQLGKKE